VTSKSSSTRRTLADLRANEHDWSGPGYIAPKPVFLDEIPARHLKQGKFGLLNPDWSTWRQGTNGQEIVTCKCHCLSVGDYQTINLYAGQDACDICKGLSDDKPSRIPRS